MTPTAKNPSVPASAYMLADHLDAALAAGEDILAVGRRRPGATAAERPDAALRSEVELIRALELALTTRVLKAREWSKALDKVDHRFVTIGRLFQAGSVALVDALADFADATEADFETGDGITAYFRSRGVIDAECAALVPGGPCAVTETFRIAGRIEVGPLLDLIAAYLDALEDQFVLFWTPPPSSVADGPPASQLAQS